MKIKKMLGLGVAVGLAASTLLGALPATANEKVITVWADETRGPALSKALGSLADQTEGEWATGYKIKVVSYSSFDALKEALDKATANTGPDVIIGANDWVATGVKNGKVAPLTLPASVRSNYTANALNDLSYQGKLYGIPISMNNTAMLVNTKLTGGKRPTTFAQMVDFYKKNKTSKKLTAGLCVAGGGMSFGAIGVFNALGGSPYVVDSKGAVSTTKDPINVSAMTANVKKFLLDSNGKSNGFFPASDTGCKDNFLAGKVPYAVIGNWEWKDYVAKGFNMNNLVSVPGLTSRTFGKSFASVSGAMLTTFAETNGNATGAKSFLNNFFGSATGVVLYARHEQRPPAHKAASGAVSDGAKAFSRTGNQAGMPQIGDILGNSAGGKNYWDALPAYWTAILTEGKDVAAETKKLNTLLKKNVVEGAKSLK
jgi:arabinogalactan oligomer/maltooligosaccharide transport system substrate-binding protein